MIIQGLQAENLFKYTKLSLTGLEGKKRVLIHGSNESGKTAIVEAICLGLFGRTVSLKDTQLTKAIKWGEENASIHLTFLARDKQSYTVFRYFNSEGQHQANLSLVGEEEPMAKGVGAVNAAITRLSGFAFQHYVDTLCLAQTATFGSVKDQTIKALAGVADLDGLANELDDVILNGETNMAEGDAQKQARQAQLTALDLKEEALGVLEKEQIESTERVATIETDINRWKMFATEMQEASERIETAVLRMSECNLESTLETWHGRTKPLQQALNGLDDVCKKNQVEMETSPNEKLRTWVNDLQKRFSNLAPIMASVTLDRDKLATWLGNIKGKTSSLTLKGETAQINEAIEQSTKRRKRNSRWGMFSLFLALLVGAAGGMLKLQAASPISQTMLTLLQKHVSVWKPDMIVYIFAGAGVFLLLALLGVKRSFKFSHQVTQHNQQIDALKTRADLIRKTVQTIEAAAKEPLSQQVERLTQLQPSAEWKGEWVADLIKWAELTGSALLKDKTQKKFLAKLQEALGSFRKEISAYNTNIAEQFEASRQEEQQHAKRIIQLGEHIEQEKARRVQDQQWRAQVADIEVKQQKQTYNLSIQRIAHQLLIGACQGLSTRFNQELRRFISKAAPLFTQGRYQHLRIDEDLSIKAFSTLKNDFVDFSELSAGARYQLLLSVRMALAQALIARTNNTPQFVVLDEPFVFFDRKRVQESLDALRNVSEKIAQVWIIVQEHEPLQEERATDLHLSCTQDGDSLSV